MKRQLFAAVFAVALCTLGAHTASAQVTTETFMLVPGIPGESNRAGYEDWIEIHSFSQNLDGRKKDEGACTVSIVKAIDRSSPLLFAATASGEMFDSIRLESFRVADDDRQPFYELTLSNAFITSFSLGASDEAVTITGERATLRYFRSNSRPVGREETKVTVHCK